jgi:hypothetical protein
MPKELEAGTQTIYAANLISYGDPLLTRVKILSGRSGVYSTQIFLWTAMGLMR